MNDTQYLKGIKVKLYPTKEQEAYLDSLFGCYRFVYNSCLSKAQEYYKETGKTAGLKVLGNYLHQQLTKEFTFLQDHNTKVLKSAVLDLLDAYKRFFVNGAGFPKYKSKKDKQVARFPTLAISKNAFTGYRMNLTKSIRKLKFDCSYEDHLYLISNREEIKSVTLCKNKDNSYHASFLIEFVPEERLPQTNNIVGIDLGVKTLATLSDTTTFENPKWYHKQEKKIKRLHRNLSRKEKGSNNREKARVRLAKAYGKIDRQRSTYIHQMTSKIISENQAIVLENLNVEGMLKNHNLAKSVQNVGLFEIKRQLRYKAKWYNRDLIEIDTFFPSSKLCSNCGNKKDELKLSERIYCCENCGFEIDRDLNAAINIRNEGLRISRETLPRSYAYGDREVVEVGREVDTELHNVS